MKNVRFIQSQLMNQNIIIINHNSDYEQELALTKMNRIPDFRSADRTSRAVGLGMA